MFSTWQIGNVGRSTKFTCHVTRSLLICADDDNDNDGNDNGNGERYSLVVKR